MHRRCTLRRIGRLSFGALFDRELDRVFAVFQVLDLKTENVADFGFHHWRFANQNGVGAFSLDAYLYKVLFQHAFVRQFRDST